MCYNKEIDIDESQNISHAITLKKHLIYWQYVEGNTIGPLDHYILTLSNYFGLAFDYTSARIVGLFLLIISLLCFYSSVSNFFNRKIATISSLILFTFYSFTQNQDFVHYTSEHLPIALWMMALAMFASIYNYNKFAPFKIFLTGLLLGMTPFAKLQIVPLSFALLLFMSYWILYVHQSSKSIKIRSLFFLTMGLIFFPIFVLAICVHYEITNDFINLYIKGNLLNAKGLTLKENITRIPFFLSKSTELISLLAFTLVCFLSSLRTSKVQTNISLPIWIVFSLVMGFFAIMKTGSNYVHYFLLIIFPLGYAIAWSLNSPKLSKRTITFCIMGIFALGISTVYFRKLKTGNFNNYVSSYPKNSTQISEVSKKIKLLSNNENDELVVWGWACNYYVETQMPHGTAMNHMHRCIFGSEMRETFRAKFYKDLLANKPTFFVDAVGKNSMWLNDKATQSYQSWPLLANYITQNYSLKENIDDVLIFKRKE
ncbi:MAG: hypothetical protein KA313_09380 [Pseudarcicella sp.]|nr:hypothetical protein [Pseudarcicella sp.]MBP6411298.1 hypothetical protein [Pseudarcicella sp.]